MVLSYFPPFPSKRCLSLSEEGTLAYGHKCNVIHLKSLSSEPEVFKGNSRIHALEWSPLDSRLSLGCDDGQVLLLSKDLKVVGRHEGHASNGVLSISWGMDGIVYSLDSAGGVIAYTPHMNHIVAYKPLSSQTKPQILAAHPSKVDIYALTASKLIYILHKSKVLKYLKHHELEITDLVWCESRLASSTVKEILLWNPLESNHYTHKLNVNNAHSRSKKEVQLAWPHKDALLSSSGSLILKWNLETKKSDVLHSLHNAESNVISLVSRKTPKATHLISLASDNNLIAYELVSSTHNYTVPTISHGVFSILPNPIEGSTLAIGAGDGKLRIWNSLGSQKGVYDVKTFWRKFKMMKIIAMAWHPDQEGLLGLGTQEGHVCTIDITSRNPEPYMYEFKHKGPVYKVLWGAVDMWNSTKGERVLFSIGDGVIVRHKSGASSQVLNDDPDSPFHSKSEKEVNNNYSDIDVKPLLEKDGENIHFALGNVDGTVSILSKEKVIASLKYHQKVVYCATWHPIYYNEDEVSKYSNWLAVSTNEDTISVWNLDSIFSEKASENTFLTNPSVILKGHDAKVVRVIWSPHDEEKLLSISYDLSAQIWNAVKGEPLANFRGHTRRLLTASWSMADPNVVLTGADDSMLYVWQVSELQDKVPPVLKKSKKSALKWDVPPATFDNVPNTKPSSSEEMESKAVPGHKPAKTKVFEKNFFTLCTKAESEYPIWEDILQLDNLNQGAVEGSSIIDQKPHLKYFLATETADDNLGGEEIDHYLKSSEFETAATLGLWLSGDLGSIIRKAMENGRLTDWLVSLAASVGHQLWMEACESYAEQLIKINSDHLKASTYFLMSQNPLKAVQVLQDGKLFRSAISLIKGRLNADGKLLKSVYESWAAFTSSDGRYELASRAWIAAGDRVAAASTLARIKDSPKALEAAGILFHRHGDLEKAELHAVQSGSIFVQGEDWRELQHLIGWAKDFKSVKYYFKPLVIAKSHLDASMKDLAEDLWLEKTSSIDIKGLIWTLHGLLCEDLNSPEEYEIFYSNFKNQSVFSSKVTYLEEIVLCTLSLHSKERSILHLVRAIEKSLTLGFNFASRLIHAVLPPNGISDPPNVGLCLWNEPLAWQCRWKELDSLQCYVSYVKLQYFLNHPETCDADIVEDISFNMMREDVVNSQKLLYDISEAEEALREYEDEETDEEESSKEPDLPNIGALSLKEPNHITPHGGNSTQTMELTSEGEWKTVLASKIPPPSDPNMPDMPPPMGLTKSFKVRFLYDKSENTKIKAQKEIQKLKWEQSRTNVLTSPYPDITQAVKDILKLLEEVKARKGDPSQKLMSRIKDIATWAYWKGTTKDQTFFLELT